MRISTTTLFDSNVTAISQQQAKLFQTQQQVSSGKRLLYPSDDPVAATKVMDLNQTDAMNTQYAANRTSATNTVTMAETALQGVTTLLQDIRTTVVGASNPGLTPVYRQQLANELSGRLNALVGLANSTDGSGNFLFAGFQSKTQPFLDTPAGVAYFGDDGQRMAQVSASRQLATTHSGGDVFMRIKSGNGTFATLPAATNIGSGVISTGSVNNPALLTGNAYQVTFNIIGGVTSYDVTNTTTGAVVSAGNPYASGQAINFDGMQFSIQGAPANGDTFSVAPSSNQSIFKTIKDVVTALNAPTVGANLTNALTQGLNNLDNAINNVSSSRAALGLRLQELDALQTDGDTISNQVKQSLSVLQDVDYTKAVSDLTMQNTALQAAMQSFNKISGLSLFNYLR